MPFELQMTVAGLCSFVRDATENKLHIVMPRGHGHESVLLYERASAGGTGTSLTRLGLKDNVLDLSGLTPAGNVVPLLPPSIVDLSELTRRPSLSTTRALVMVARGKVNAVVAVRPHIVEGRGHHKYAAGRTEFELASRIELWIRIAGDSLPLGKGAPTLKPGSNNKLRVGLAHATNDAIPEQWEDFETPRSGAGVDHFPMFYDLFNVPSGSRRTLKPKDAAASLVIPDLICIGSRIPIQP